MRVTAIIPTTLRSPAQLERAVASVLAQTRSASELIVVVDTADSPLPKFESPLVKVVRNRGPAHGPGAARNLGIQHAQGDWIALLDDDDYWSIDKLEKQFALWQLHESGADVVIASRAWLVADCSAWISPQILPDEANPLVQYLFGPTHIFRSATRAVYTPTLLTQRSLFIRHPFDETMQSWEDYDWLLRVCDDGARLIYCPEALTICDQTRSSGPSLSQRLDASRFDTWARKSLLYRSIAAYHHFRLTYVVPALVHEGKRSAAAGVVIDALKAHKATWPLVAKTVVTIAAPEALERAIKRWR